MRVNKAFLTEMYHGDSEAAIRFRSILLVFDAVIIAFFIAAPFMKESRSFLLVEYLIGVFLAADLVGRAWGYESVGKWIARPIVWFDLAVLVSLLFPQLPVNLAFLRVLRAASLVNSRPFWQTVGRGRWLDSSREELTKATVNLIVFVFVVTGFVHSTFAARTAGINSYIDSLYFTVASLTTTGYGDITLPGTSGRLISILIMVVGVSLFIRLVQLLVRPAKVVHECKSCGLRRHEPDAVHCKGCGGILHISHDND